jgi:predicted pyridoxine 5'-phosphate oxidase superfamily flavin-nucleotide-binding protein
MPHAYAEIAFTPAVKALQEEDGSRASYARMEAAPGARNAEIGEREAAFIGQRDSLYMATVSETGWPYLQHRGGPKGFVRVLDGKTLAFADHRGNRQHVSEGNLRHDDRASFFFMDYANRARLKLYGRVRVVGADEDPELVARLAPEGYDAVPERAFVVTVEAFDWNCPQHIVRRYAEDDVVAAMTRMQERIDRLEAENAALARAAAPG